MKQTKEILKSYFETGDKPTQAQFESLIDSFVHEDDTNKVYISSVDNIDGNEAIINFSDGTSLTVQKPIAPTTEEGCFHFDGHTLKMCNLQTKLNDTTYELVNGEQKEYIVLKQNSAEVPVLYAFTTKLDYSGIENLSLM